MEKTPQVESREVAAVFRECSEPGCRLRVSLLSKCQMHGREGMLAHSDHQILDRFEVCEMVRGRPPVPPESDVDWRDYVYRVSVPRQRSRVLLNDSDALRMVRRGDRRGAWGPRPVVWGVDGLLPVDYLMNYVELKEVVGRFLAEVLGSVEELVVRLRFGIFGVMTYRGESLDLDFTVRYADGLTLDEVGELIERSRSRVKQIEDCALRKLRRRRRVLRDFYGERGRGVVRRRKVKPGERKPYYGEP
jgi:hypothetical protein